MKKTNHVLWAIITILTGGIGAIAWIAITLSNNQYNKKHHVIGVYVEEKEEEPPRPDQPIVVIMGAILAILFVHIMPVTEWINEFTNSTHGEDAQLILSIGVALATAYEIYKYLDFNKKNSL